MTQRRHLKDLVRGRMARTGESYSTARAHVARRARTEVRGNPTVIVPVTDMDRAASFYAALGFHIRSATPTWTTLGDDEETLALEPATEVGVDVGIGIKVADLPVTLAAVVNKGGRIESQAGPVAWITDPDGNTLRLMAVNSPAS